jgi:hypothetical protein
MIKNLEIKRNCFFDNGQNGTERRFARRAGVHIDGNYVKSSWGGDQGGWKVGEGGRLISSAEHKACYQSTTGGMLIASTYPAAEVEWKIRRDAYIGGDCTRIQGLR